MIDPPKLQGLAMIAKPELAAQVLPPDRMLSRSEVVEHFGIGLRFLETAATRGDGPPFVKVGRSVRYLVSDLRSWIEARRYGSTSEVTK